MVDFSYKRPGQLAMAVISLLYVSTAFAEDDANALSMFSVHGFGTLGAVYHNENGVKFRRDISQAGGARAGHLSFVQDSMLGGQLTANLSQQFEASVQVLSRLTTDNNIDPQVSWAYLKYKPFEGMDIRVGRLGIETYIQGDSAEIGYANLLIRQPIIFYPRTYNGVDAEIIRPLGAGTLRLKGFGGWTQGKLIGNGAPFNLEGSKIVGAGVEYARDGWTGRVAFGRLQLNNEVDELKPGSSLRVALGMTPNGVQILDALSMKDRTLDFRSLALAYDGGQHDGIIALVDASPVLRQRGLSVWCFYALRLLLHTVCCAGFYPHRYPGRIITSNRHVQSSSLDRSD
jgi:hypothetical protein